MSSMGLPLQSLFEVSTVAAMVGQLDTPTGAHAGPGIGAKSSDGRQGCTSPQRQGRFLMP
ncbi:hypothetical protein BD413DRAFT_579655 [Trametes elegans]|nr:hypothetical protein BD413DRAFT_579655 [Trametes elegans]